MFVHESVWETERVCIMSVSVCKDLCSGLCGGEEPGERERVSEVVVGEEH